MDRLICLVLGILLGMVLACGNEIDLSGDAIEFDKEPTHLKVIPEKKFLTIPSLGMKGFNSFESKRLKKRQTETLNLRIYVLIDYVLYKRYLQIENNDTDKAIKHIRYFYARVINRVNDKYVSIDTGSLRYKVVLIGYYVCQSESQSTFTEHPDLKTDDPNMIKYGGVLGQLEKWATENSDVVKDFTTIAAFTTYRDKSASGMAFVSRACTKSGVSINLSAGLYATANIVAHEIGHTLGSSHDGEDNDCKAQDHFLMTAIMSPNVKNQYFTFSPCTRDYFEEYISNLKSDVKATCFKDKTNSLDEELKKYLELLPGQKYSVDETCQQIFGLDSYYCTPGANANEEICSTLNCWWASNGACYNSIESRGMDGTPCGNRTWCINGQCVFDERAPIKDEYCMYGELKDTLTFNNVEYKCSDLNSQPALCYYEFFREYCCETCTRIKEENKDITSCEYGDRQQRIVYNNKPVTCEDFLTQNGYCYLDSFRKICCKTCYTIGLTYTNPDCPYGNKMYSIKYNNKVLGCTDFTQYPSLCNNEGRKKACCKTCGELVTFDNNTECSFGKGNCESVQS